MPQYQESHSTKHDNVALTVYWGQYTRASGFESLRQKNPGEMLRRQLLRLALLGVLLVAACQSAAIRPRAPSMSSAANSSSAPGNLKNTRQTYAPQTTETEVPQTKTKSFTPQSPEITLAKPAGPAAETTETATTVLDKEETKSRHPSGLLGRYEVFNAVAIGTSRLGQIKPGEYYWGSFVVTAERKLRFFVDAKLQQKYQSYFTERDLKTANFSICGELPASGDLSRLYFTTPRQSGFLFSGSIRSRKGMTNLVPLYYQGRLVRVKFTKRPLQLGRQ